MEEYFGLISQVGFPIFISIWFMMRTEKVIMKNTETMEKIIALLDNKR